MTLAAGAAECALSFVRAITWDERGRIWELLSERGREAVLNVAVSSGLDRVTAQRIGQSLADPADLEAFLERLAAGLRCDFSSVAIEEIVVAGEPELCADGSVAVNLAVPSALPGTDFWPAGRVLLSPRNNATLALPNSTGTAADLWAVDRVEPIIVGPAH